MSRAASPVDDAVELLRSPAPNEAALIADDAVASGCYRRPSLSPADSLRSVTATSPLSSPADETEPHRGGRRNLLRSGTSGSITPLSATSPDPSPSPTAMTTPAPTSHAAASASTNRRATEASTSSRTDALLVVATPMEEMFRSPSQQSAASDADGYFTARPGSPSDAGDLIALARTRSALRRERVSWSGRSYATCSSSIHPDPIDADLAATSTTLTLDDEACYVDGDPLSPTDKTAQASRTGVDFLSCLPPELALCILFMLDSHVDLLAASAVSKRWRAIAMDQAVWRNLFFSRPGWAIREDAPMVLQHQAELKRIEAHARRTAAREEAERLRRLQEQRKAASTSSPYLDRLAALKSWRETLHIPSFPLAGLSLGSTEESSRRRGEAVSPSSVAAPMSPLRSPTAATGRFGLFLSPARPAPSTPAGARRAQEAAAGASYFAHDAPMSRQPSTSSTAAGTDAPSSRRHSLDSNFAEVAEAEEFFAASLNWTRLYRDRHVLEQRWLRGHEPSRSDATVDSTTRVTKMFEPSKRFLRGHQDSVYCIRQDDGVGTGTAGKLVSGSRDRTIRVWDVESGTCKHVLQGHTASVLSLQYDDAILVSVSSDAQVFVWDFAAILATPAPSPTETAEAEALVHDKRERLHCVLRDHTSAVLDVVFSNDWIVTGSKDTTVRVWRRCDVVAREQAPVAYRKFSHTGPVNAVDLQGNRVVSASGEGSMFLWDLESGDKVHTFSGHTKGLACIVFKGNTLVSGSNDQTIRVWDTVSGACTHVLGEHHMLVRTVAYCPVRNLVVSGGYDRMIKLWHIGHPSTPAEPPNADTMRDDISAQAQDGTQDEPEGEQNGPPRDAALGTCLRDFRCHRARIFDVDFNTTRIVSASEDHLICITHFGGKGIDASLFA